MFLDFDKLDAVTRPRAIDELAGALDALTSVLALSTILLLDSGEECEVVQVWNGYSWCEPL